MNIFTGIVRLAVGLIFGVLAALALMPITASFYAGSADSRGFVVTAFAILVGLAICFFAPTIRRAFGRGFLLSGVSFAALPLSMMVLTGRATTSLVGDAAPGDQLATAVGAGLAGAAITGLAAFIGLIVGGILIVIGLVLVLGGRREVIVVHQRATDG